MTKSNGSFRLRALIALAGTAVLPAIALAQPANDNCSSPATATTGANFGTNVAATNDGNPEPPCGVDDTYTEDVWFTFTTNSAGEYIFDTEGSVILDDTLIEVYSSCGGTLLGCDDDAGTGFLSRLIVTLGASQNVRIRVAGYDGAEGDFVLNITESGPPSSNDSCGLPTALSLSSSTPGTTVGYTFNGPQSSCAFFGLADGPDAFFVFTPTVTRLYTFTLTPTDGAFDSVLVAGSSCSFTSAACSDNTGTAGLESVTVTGTAGVPVYVRAAGWGGEEGDFEISVVDAGAPASNDVCSTPATLTLGSPVSGSTAGLTPDGPQSSCAFDGEPDGPDAFYTFTPTANDNYLITVTPTDGIFDPIVVAGTDCTFTTSNCADDTAGGEAERVVFAGTTGVPIRVRVTGWDGSSGAYDIAVSIAPPAAPNDICDNATPITVGATLNGDTTAAQNEGVTASCTSGTRDLWYTFTAPNDGVFVFVVDGPLGNSISFFDGCGGAEISCALADSAPVQNAISLTTGEIVKVRVAGFGNADNAFTINVTEAVAPANDDCETAAAVDLSSPSSVSVQGLGAQNDLPDVACNLGTTDVAHGVWFTFTTGIDAGTLTVADTNFNDTVFALFTGSCGALTEVGCSDPSPHDFVLSSNTTYFLLVGMWGTSAPGAEYAMTFSFEAVSGACCVANNCQILSASACATASGSFIGGSCVPSNGVFSTATTITDYPDGGPSTVVEMPLSVSNSSGNVTALSVTVDIDHAYLGDVLLQLRGPNNTVVDLMGRIATTACPAPGDLANGDDLAGEYTFVDNATESIYNYALNGALAIIPEGPYQAANCSGTQVVLNSEFASSTANGTWTLLASDEDEGVAGVVNSWSISINGGPSSVCGGGNPTPCEIADFNGAGGVTADDIFAFLDAWFAQNGQTGANLSADANGSDSVTADDIFFFLDLWFTYNGQTCP